jgi:hypothetical protein
VKLKIVTTSDSLEAQSSPEWAWSEAESDAVRAGRGATLATREDFLALEARESEKEAFQPFVAPYLERAKRCLVVGAGWGLVERRWVDAYRAPGRRMLLTDVNDVALEPIARLWDAETMRLDVLDASPTLYGQFDLTYAVLVEFAFDDARYVAMASNMRQYLDRVGDPARLLLVVSNVRMQVLMNPIKLGYRWLDLDHRLPAALLARAGRPPQRVIGWQRTIGAHRRLLRRAGLDVTRVVPLFDDGSLWSRFGKVGASKFVGIEAVPRW